MVSLTFKNLLLLAIAGSAMALPLEAGQEKRDIEDRAPKEATSDVIGGGAEKRALLEAKSDDVSDSVRHFAFRAGGGVEKRAPTEATSDVIGGGAEHASDLVVVAVFGHQAFAKRALMEATKFKVDDDEDDAVSDSIQNFASRFATVGKRGASDFIILMPPFSVNDGAVDKREPHESSKFNILKGDVEARDDASAGTDHPVANEVKGKSPYAAAIAAADPREILG